VVISAYLRTDGQGLVGIVQGSDLGANGLMAFEHAEVVPL
jgi:hypothetical protein